MATTSNTARRAQPVRVDALAAALHELGINVDAAELIAVVREQEQLLRPRPTESRVGDPDRMKDPLYREARRRMIEEDRAFINSLKRA